MRLSVIDRLLCALFEHRYVVARVFSPESRQVTCTRCQRLWAMNDSVRAFVPWDGTFEQMYREFGQWPGTYKEPPHA